MGQRTGGPGIMQTLAKSSKHVFVWHENAGQTVPSNDSLIKAKTNATGFSIDIADNAVIHEPILILSSANNNSNAKHSVNVGKNAAVQIIEYIMSDDANAKNSVASIINCADGAQVKHCLLLQAADQVDAEQDVNSQINQASSSRFDSHIFSFGGKLSKINMAVAMQGQHAEYSGCCLAYTHAVEAQNVLLTVDHLQPSCTSSTIVRGVLKDSSRTDFVGKVVVHPGAAKTFADLQIKNILCSTQALANNKPELEIYNDDVRCSHGSSTGQINEDQLFYMCSRGLDPEEAKSMLIEGFIQPVIASCKIPMISDYVLNIIAGR